MFKKIIALLLTVAVCIPYMSVSAADTGVPDLIITDVRISNPDYEVGDIVAFDIDIKNVGTAPMRLGWVALSNLSGIKSLVRLSNWTRPYIFPGQTITTTLPDFEVTSESVTLKALCNSSSRAEETNRSNNTLQKSFTPKTTKTDLVIKDVRLSETNISDGNVATFEIDYANDGITDIPQSDIDIKLTIGRQTYTVSETTAVLAGELRTVTTQPLYVKGDTATVYLHINPDNKVSETITDDNEVAYQFNALVSKAEDYTWQPVRIGGGGWPRVGYVNEYIKDQVFQLADVNGVYKYDPYTKMHVNLTKNLQLGRSETIGHGYCLSIGFEQDPVNSDILYYAGGTRNASETLKDTCVVLRSDNGGKNWKSMNIPFEFGTDLSFCSSVINLDPNNSNVLYVSTAAGLWRTKNAKSASPKWEKLTLPGVENVKSNGSTSDAKPTFATPVVGVVADKSSTVTNGLSQTVYAIARNLGVFKSTDGGATFALMSGSPTGSLTNLFVDSNGGLVVSGVKGAWEYSNSEWTEITPSDYKSTIQSSNIPVYATVHPNNPNLLAAVLRSIYNEAVLYSTDRGKTWKSILQPMDSSTGDYAGTVHNLIPWQESKQIGSSPSWVAFDPFNDKRLFVNAWYGTYQTIDYTASTVKWEETTWGIEESFVRSLLPMPKGAAYEILHGSNDFGGLAINDVFKFGAKKFSPATTEVTGLDYMESDINFVVRCGGSERGAGAGNGFYSKDGGSTWTQFPTAPLKADGKTKQYITRVVVSRQNNSNGMPAIMIISLGSPDNLAEGSVAGRVWRSADLGQTWTYIDSLPVNSVGRFLDTCEPLAADSVDKDKFYFYDFRTGDVYRSMDNGVSFSVVGSLPKGDNESSIMAVPGKEGELYVNLSYNGLWHSTDGGNNWTKVPNVNRARFFDLGKEASCSVNQTMYVLGEVKGIYGVFRSTDLGQNWVRIDDPDQESLWNRLTLLKADKREFGRVYIGTNGSGIIMGYPGEDRMQAKTAIYNLIDNTKTTASSISVTGGSTKPGTAYISVNGGTATAYPLDENNRFSATINLSSYTTYTIEVYSIDSDGNRSMSETYSVRRSLW